MSSRPQSHSSERLPRPSSNSSRSAWQDDGLDAPGRPSSSSTEGGSVKKVDSKPNKTMEKKRKIIAARKNCCARFIDSIWSTKHTQDLMDKEQKAKTMLRELIIYCIFLAIISTIIFSMSSSTMFTMTKVMMDLFVHAQFSDTKNTYEGMLTQTDFWRFAEGPLMDGLYWETYYNGKNVSDSDLGYIYHENKLLGVPRVRQLRVKNDSCKVYTMFEKTIDSCYGSYSNAANDDAAYGLETETAWVYHTEKEMNGSSHRATIKTYPGAGFYQDLANTKAKSMDMVRELKQNQWLDRGTRAVFIDFTVFNPNVNLFCVTRLVVEFPPTGGAVSSYQFSTVKLLRYVTIGDFIIMGCEIVFCVFILYYFVEEAIELKRLKLTYFQEFWNIMDIAVILLSIFCISFNVYRVRAVELLLDDLLRSPDQYADFYDLAFWQFQFKYGVAFMVFIAWVKLFKYISFNKTMTQLTDTIYSAKGNLAGFMVMFMVVYIAFAQLGYLFFGESVYDFKTVQDAIMTLFRIILGDFNFAQLSEAHSVLGPLYFIGYIVLVFLVLFNMFLAIINDSYSEVKAATADAENEFEVLDFFKSQYKKVLGKLNVKRDRLADIQDALAAADANNDSVIEYEEWKAELLMRGYKEDEIEQAFQKFDTDGNRTLDAEEQANMLKALEEEKKAVDMDIGAVEHKLGINERPKTSRAKTGRSRTARSRDGTTDSKDGEKPHTRAGRRKRRLEKMKVISEVGYGEFSTLSRRVDRMEHSIGNIVGKIDTVLVKLEGMERAKLKRREAMTQLLDQIAESEDTTEEDKRLYMERLVREELERWDNETSISRPGTAMSRPGTSKTRPGTSRSIK